MCVYASGILPTLFLCSQNQKDAFFVVEHDADFRGVGGAVVSALAFHLSGCM